MDALHRLATELTVHLARVCGTCDDCEDGCPFDDLEDGMLELPDYLREEAGIPAGAKLCVYVDDEEKTVTIAEAGYDHDLRDVPPYLLEMLGEAGICLGELEEQLMVGNLIYGERTAYDEMNIQTNGTMVMMAAMKSRIVRMMPPILRDFMPVPPNLQKP